MYCLTPEACENAKAEIETKLKNEWKKWTRKDFTLSNYPKTTTAKPLILCRAANEARIKQFLQENNCFCEQGLTLEGFDLLVGEHENQGILKLHRQEIDEIEETLHKSQEKRLSWEEVEILIGDNGEQNSGWRVEGLSYSTCQRFLKGKENIRNQDNFSFLCDLLNINSANQWERISSENSIRLSVFNNLKNRLNNIDSPRLKNKITNLFRKYLIVVENDSFNDISQNNYVQLINRITDYDNPVLFQLLNSLAKDSSLKQEIRNILDEELQNLREQLRISDCQFNEWTRNIIDPSRNLLKSDKKAKSYLIVKINKSDNHLTNSLYKIEDVHFLDSSYYPPKKEDYENLHEIVEKYENERREREKGEYREYCSPQALKLLIGRLVTYCCEMMSESSFLIIECFTNKALLSINIDCWEYELDEDCSKLGSYFWLHIRCLERIDPKYSKLLNFRALWVEKWTNIHKRLRNLDENTAISFREDPDRYFRDPSTVWVNLCTSDSEQLNRLFPKLLKGGIPMAVWSRCHQQYQAHRTEINELVNQCDGEAEKFPQIIQERRRNTPSFLDVDPENLGHHLSLLWEDPNLIPPFAPLTSGHVSQ